MRKGFPPDSVDPLPQLGGCRRDSSPRLRCESFQHNPPRTRLPKCRESTIRSSCCTRATWAQSRGWRCWRRWRNRSPRIRGFILSSVAMAPSARPGGTGCSSRQRTLLPLQPLDRLNDLMNAADIHLLPQRASAADLVMPSRLSAMLSSGRPVIATAHAGTQIAQVVEGRGLAVPAEDADALHAAVLQPGGRRRTSSPPWPCRARVCGGAYRERSRCCEQFEADLKTLVAHSHSSGTVGHLPMARYAIACEL